MPLPQGTNLMYKDMNLAICPDPFANSPQTIPLVDMKKGNAKFEVNPSISPTLFPSANELASSGQANQMEKAELKQTKKINWGASIIIWLGPNAIAKLRSYGEQKKNIEIEVE